MNRRDTDTLLRWLAFVMIIVGIDLAVAIVSLIIAMEIVMDVIGA